MSIIKLGKSDKRKVFRKKVEDLSGEPIKICNQCGECSGGCPESAFMELLPNQVMHKIQLGDESVLDSNTYWICSTCFVCSARCPKGIDIAKVMESLREISLRAKKHYVELSDISKEEISLLVKNGIDMNGIDKKRNKLIRKIKNGKKYCSITMKKHVFAIFIHTDQKHVKTIPSSAPSSETKSALCKPRLMPGIFPSCFLSPISTPASRLRVCSINTRGLHPRYAVIASVTPNDTDTVGKGINATTESPYRVPVIPIVASTLTAIFPFSSGSTFGVVEQEYNTGNKIRERIRLIR